MAKDNKNKKDLAARDDDPTSEMEVPTWRRDDIGGIPTLEADADTFGLGKTSTGADDQLRRLQFQLEQQRALRAGLEAEVAARDEIATRLQGQVDELSGEIGEIRSRLSERESSLRDLKQEIRERNELYHVVIDEVSELKSGIHNASSDAEHNAVALAEQRETSERLQQALDEARLRIDELQTRAEADRTALADADARLSARTSELHETRALLASRDREIEALRSSGSAGQKASPAGPLLASKDREIAELTVALQQLESHTDRIRQQLQDELARAGALAEERDALKADLDRKIDVNLELKKTLEETNARIEALEDRQAILKDNHAEEIRLIRFELGEAQATVSQHELINEQLASDLLQTRGFKESLEEMLTESERSQQAEIDQLSQLLKTARAEITRFEQQIETKNEAINCLLAELAAKRERATARKDIDSTDSHEELPDEVAERLQDGERVTRFLIGDVDGREVQFPLFKSRLTIGRTSVNDIQLTADYISRRHAVIVTEGDVTRIIDWGSRNGVFVNSERVTEHFLSSGDKVTIATFEFLYEERKRADKA